jgi:MFS family permease
MGVLGVVGLVLILLLEEPYRPDAGNLSANGVNPGLFWRLLWTGRVRSAGHGVCCWWGLAFGTLSTFVPLYVRETGLRLNVGLIYTASAIASFSLRLLVGRASDRHGRGRFITVSLGIYSLSMLVFLAGRQCPYVPAGRASFRDLPPVL